MRFSIENEPDIEKALFALIYSSSIAKPLINHTGISLAVSMTATNIINKCETAKHLKSKCMEIQLQGKRGRGTAAFPTLLVFSWPDSEETVIFFFLEILTRKEKSSEGLRF